MAPENSKAAFLRIPWAASLLNQPDVICHVPGSRKYKASTEDSLFAETLTTSRTIRSCISFHQKPTATQEKIGEMSTLIMMGDGMNGHPNILHGGIVASILDEGMGVLQMANYNRDHLRAVGEGKALGELPPSGGSFTAELKVRYLKPVLTPGALIVTARYQKIDGRKEWIHAEIKQRGGDSENENGDEVICATCEALFIIPRPKRSKL